MFALKIHRFSCKLFPLAVHHAAVGFCLAGGQHRRVGSPGGKSRCPACGVSSSPPNPCATSNSCVKRKWKKSSKLLRAKGRHLSVRAGAGQRCTQPVTENLFQVFFQPGDWIQTRELSGLRAVFQRCSIFFQLPSLCCLVFALDVRAWHATFPNYLKGCTQSHSADGCHRDQHIPGPILQFWVACKGDISDTSLLSYSASFATA